MAYGQGISAQLCLHLVLDVEGVGVVEISRSVVAAHVRLIGILSREGEGVELGIVLHLLLHQAESQGSVVRRCDVKGCGKRGNSQRVCSILAGEGTVALNLGSTHKHTRKRVPCGHVQHRTFDYTCGVFTCSTGLGTYGSTRNLFLR